MMIYQYTTYAGDLIFGRYTGGTIRYRLHGILSESPTNRDPNELFKNSKHVRDFKLELIY